MTWKNQKAILGEN